MWVVSASTDQVDLPEHEPGDVVRLCHHCVTGPHAARRQRLDAPEQLLVLELFVAEANERLERDLIAEPVITAHLEQLRVDEPLDEPE